MQTNENKEEKSSKSRKMSSPAGAAAGSVRKKAIPVRKLLEMERQSLDNTNALSVNDENDLSDANRVQPSATSILGSLERLVETSFKPNAGTTAEMVAQRMILAKRALQMEADEGGSKKAKTDLNDDECQNVEPSAAEMKFLKYSELAKELSSGRWLFYKVSFSHCVGVSRSNNLLAKVANGT